MFGIGDTELVIILLFAFMIFGPDKLPGAGRTIGRALRQFRDAQEGITKVVQTEVLDPAAEAMSDEPKKRPTRNRAAEVDDDADIDGATIAATRAAKGETFAERKARLAAEKAAREAEEAAAAEAEAEAESQPEALVADVDSDADVDPAAAVEPEPAPEPVAAPAPEPVAEEPKRATAQDLYAMKPKRAAKAEPAADANTNTGEEAGEAEA